MKFSIALFLGVFYVSSSLLAYIVVPRNTADSTDRMNAGGDPPDRPGLKDIQRAPEYLDDFWGKNDYYYSKYGITETGGAIRNPIYDTDNPPYYPYPNTDYYDPSVRDYNYNTRYYRPYYPR